MNQKVNKKKKSLPFKPQTVPANYVTKEMLISGPKSIFQNYKL